eukprot:SAG11_NODE_1195_length_5546_cov_3.668809_4_plen_183_part_00
MTRREWPDRWFPIFAAGTTHGMNRALVDCFGGALRGSLDTARDSAVVPTEPKRRINVSVWMEDVAHAVWFDRCVDAAAAAPPRDKGKGAAKAAASGCRLYDPRFSKAPTAEECRGDAIAIGSISSAPAIKHIATAGRKGDCGCLSGRQSCAKAGGAPILRCGDSDTVLGRESANVLERLPQH